MSDNTDKQARFNNAVANVRAGVLRTRILTPVELRDLTSKLAFDIKQALLFGADDPRTCELRHELAFWTRVAGLNWTGTHAQARTLFANQLSRAAGQERNAAQAGRPEPQWRLEANARHAIYLAALWRARLDQFRSRA